jgi:hypothetical protein
MPLKDKKQNRDYQRAWAKARRERNREKVNQYKLEKGCSDCGYKEHPAGLEFDHIGHKNANVAMLMGQDKKLWEEIKLCEVVCGTCHGIRTWNRQRKDD